jgi:SAM-dependent methyltransferase
MPGTSLALEAYEAMAPAYDAFTADYEYVRWLDAIEIWAVASGLSGRRLLDVACGTGKSFLPMLARGYTVTACDLSPRMVAEAQKKAPNVNVIVADMRALPWTGRFDFVTCLDDAFNYLLTEEDLDRALRSIAAALAPGGILVFDTNSLSTYRTTFSERFAVRSGDWEFTWCGQTHPRFQAGGVARAWLEVSGPNPCPPSQHVQRHWPVDRLRVACEAAGFDQVAFRGQVTGGRLLGDPDESMHTKIVCLARRPRDGRGTRQVPRSMKAPGRRFPVVVKT